MRILAHKSVNLHSESLGENGLVHIPAGVSKAVPDDVVKHPGFKMLEKSGHIVRLAEAEPEQQEEDAGAKSGNKGEGGSRPARAEESKDKK